MSEKTQTAAKTTAAKPAPPVTAAPGLVLQRCACGGTPGVDGECADCHAKRLQRSAVGTDTPAEVPPLVHAVLASNGQSLDAATQADMSARFGHDFSQVRVHTDAQAAESAQAVNALAYTVGRDVVFGAGQYAPGTSAGQRLLAHELTHTIQQAGIGPSQLGGMAISNPTDNAEREAERAASSSVFARSVELNSHSVNMLARQADNEDMDVSDAGVETQDASAQVTDAGDGPIDAGLPGGVTTPPPPPPTWVPPTTIHTVQIWLKAFIPRDVPGQSHPAPAHPGKTMLDGPFPWSDCFLTDSRGFDSSVSSSARMHSLVEIELTTPSVTRQTHWCDPTVKLDCDDGTEHCRNVGNSSRMSFGRLSITSSSSFSIFLQGAANNPCVGGSPDIDYLGTMNVDVSSRTVTFAGLIDGFPAFEMYAAADGGAGVALFGTLPPPGNSPWNLIGDANRTQSGSATI